MSSFAQEGSRKDGFSWTEWEAGKCLVHSYLADTDFITFTQTQIPNQVFVCPVLLL